MSYNPYAPPPLPVYNPQHQQQHPPPNQTQGYNQGQNQGQYPPYQPPPGPTGNGTYDRPPMNNPHPHPLPLPPPPPPNSGYASGGYGSQYDQRRDSRDRDNRGPLTSASGSAPAPGGYGGYGGYGGRDLSPSRRNYPPPPRDDRSFNEDRGNGGRGFSRDRDREPSGSGPGPGGRPKKDNRLIAERIEQERQCRTLFVRNISFEAEPERLKVDFERHGEVKSWFDMISRRGMVFVTFFDLRAAQRAKDALHGIKVGSRQIDVHYGLPKEEDLKSKCDREKNQGSVLMILKPHVDINMFEAGRMCDSFGEVRSLRACNSASQAICEYWDSRGAIDLFDNMNGKPFERGTWDMKYIWDEPPAGHAKESAVNQRKDGSSGRGRRVSEQSRGYGDRESFPPPPRDRYSDHPPVPPVDDRLDQARKVQQLLANLGNVAPPPPPPPPASNQYPPYANGPRAPPAPPPGNYNQGPPPTSNYPPPPAPYSNNDNSYGNPSRGPPPPSRSNSNAPPPPSTGPGYAAPPTTGYAGPPPISGPPPASYGGGGAGPPATYNNGPPPPVYNQPNNYTPQPAYTPPPPPPGQRYGQPPPAPYQPSAPAPQQGQGGYNPSNQIYRPPPPGPGPGGVPVAADPRRPPPQAAQYRPPPPQVQGGGNSEVGNLLAMLNQKR